MPSLILIQHCQAEHPVNNLTGGWTDTALTSLGERQAQCVAERLQRELGQRPAVLYSSDLSRAWQTAQIIGQTLGLMPQAVPALREFKTGIAAGKTQAWADAHVAPRPPRGIGLDRQPFPDAETPRTFFERVTGWLRQLPLSSELVSLLVTHGGTVSVILAWWLQLSVEQYVAVAFRTAPGSLSILRSNE